MQTSELMVMPQCSPFAKSSFSRCITMMCHRTSGRIANRMLRLHFSCHSGPPHRHRPLGQPGGTGGQQQLAGPSVALPPYRRAHSLQAAQRRLDLPPSRTPHPARYVQYICSPMHRFVQSNMPGDVTWSTGGWSHQDRDEDSISYVWIIVPVAFRCDAYKLVYCIFNCFSEHDHPLDPLITPVTLFQGWHAAPYKLVCGTTHGTAPSLGTHQDGAGRHALLPAA